MVITRHNFKKDRTICRECFYDTVMYFIKKRYNSQSSDINDTNNIIKDNDPKCVSLKK